MSKHEKDVPKDIRFKTKPEIALDQIRWACEAGLPRGVAALKQDAPLMLEHLKSAEEYAEGAAYIKKVGGEIGLAFV